MRPSQRVCPGTEFEAKNTIALEKLKLEFRGKIEVLQLPAPVSRDLKKLSADVVAPLISDSDRTRPK